MQLLKDEFFPTPRELVKEMVFGLDVCIRHTILEPSAGTGELIETLLEECADLNRHNMKDNDIDVVEIDPELRYILKGKGIRVVHDDFLTYNTLKRYDWIFMNPPFSCGDRHLRKALELLKDGGTCVCLLNQETLANPYTNSRKALLQQLEEWNYEQKIIHGAFKQAERKTDVDVVMVKVTKPQIIERVSILLDGLKREQEEESRFTPREQTSLIDNDPIHAAICQCRLEQMLGLRLLKEYEALNPYLQENIQTSEENEDHYPRHDSPLIKIDITPDDYIRKIRIKYWNALFQNPVFTGQLTSNLQKELYERVMEMQHYDFSEVNILALQAELSRNVLNGVNVTIIELFDELSRKYSWLDIGSKNIHYYNGWKTNLSWKINKKVILPLNGTSRFSNTFGRIYFEWHARKKLEDIEKCLDYLDGNKKSQMSTSEYISAAERSGETKDIFLKHIKVTFYKKGTAHIEFLDEELLERLNIHGSLHKNWLPPGYGKTRYEDLPPESRDVIDSFQGQEAYRRTCERKDVDFLDIGHQPFVIGCSV